MRLFRRGKVWYTWAYDEHGERIQRSTRCHDRKAAEVVARDLERSAADPDHAAQEGALLVDALTLLVEDRQARSDAGTRSSETVVYYQRKTGHLRRFFGDGFRLAALRARDVDGYIARRRQEPEDSEKKTSESTIAKELGALGAALRLAKRAGIWKGDVDAILPVGFSPEYEPRKRWLPMPEAQRFLAELTAGRGARVAFIIATGARWSESDRAQREDVNIAQAVVETVGGVARVRGAWVTLRGTKTHRSRGLVTIPIVLPLHLELVRYALAYGRQAGGALFEPWPNVRRDMAAAAVRAGIDACSPNDLRRSTAHQLRGEGAPLDDLADVLRHVDTRMVQRVYARRGPEELAASLHRTTRSGAAPVQQGPARRAKSAGSPKEESPMISVPRDGIEPPTRGFSILGILLPTPRKPHHSRAGAAPVQQPRRLRAVRGGKS